MAMNLTYYLNFNGNCEDALNFYKQALNGEIKGLQTFGQSPMPSAEEYKNRILHAELHFGNNMIMASDTMPDRPGTEGTNFSLSLNFTDTKEEETIYHRLSDGGEITLPLQDTFWGARFGMIKDKFGISWMFNCLLPGQQSM